MCFELIRSRCALNLVPPYPIGKSGPHVAHGDVRKATSFHSRQAALLRRLAQCKYDSILFTRHSGPPQPILFHRPESIPVRRGRPTVRCGPVHLTCMLFWFIDPRVRDLRNRGSNRPCSPPALLFHCVAVAHSSAAQLRYKPPRPLILFFPSYQILREVLLAPSRWISPAFILQKVSSLIRPLFSLALYNCSLYIALFIEAGGIS